jgi:hypothetical protein
VPHDRGLALATGGGLLAPTEVQPQSRRALGWDEWLRGARLAAGDRLGTP